MKYLLSILCLFVLSCDSDGDGVCSYENACNYGENAECYYFVPTHIAVDADEYHTNKRHESIFRLVFQ